MYKVWQAKGFECTLHKVCIITLFLWTSSIAFIESISDSISNGISDGISNGIANIFYIDAKTSHLYECDSPASWIILRDSRRLWSQLENTLRCLIMLEFNILYACMWLAASGYFGGVDA